MVRQARPSPADFIYPIFLRKGADPPEPVESMPGVFRFSPERVVDEAEEVANLGVPAVLLFGIPDRKDPRGTSAHDPDGAVQRATSLVKERLGEQLIVATDVCLCGYTDHGHCGVMGEDGRLDIDQTNQALAMAAVSHARAGADLVAPSAMSDGQVAAIRQALDDEGFQRVAIMSYSAKYASSFYGPFREAAESAPAWGDRRAYQMDPGNAREALREVEQDLAEGADVVMVKPAMAYLDVLKAVKEKFEVPVAAYSVSGEYSMVKAAGANGWVDEEAVAKELLVSIKRAGADLIITYFAKEAARWFGIGGGGY